MPIYRVQGPDGKIHRFEGPEGAAPEAIEAAAAQQFGTPSVPEAQPVQEPAPVPQQTAAAAPPAPPAPLGQSPFRGGVRGERTLSGEATAPKVPVPSVGQLAGDYGSIAKGAGIGAVSGLPGMPGDIESLGRLLLSPAGVSRETALPTSERVGNFIAGPPSNQYEANARIGGTMLSPGGYGKVAKTAANISGFLTKHALGLTTGAGAPAISEAFQAGKQGGQAATTFLEHMRGGSTVSDDAVRMAKEAVEEMRLERSTAYKSGIGSTIKGDPTVLDFAPIDSAVASAASVKTFKGRSLSAVANSARQRIGEVIAEWRALDPAEFHTPEGLDALKQELGDLIHEGALASVKPNSPAAIIVNNAYNAVKDQIVKQAPGYGKVMKDYEEASKEIREVTTSLSLGNKATADTSLRKLQSILRNNANTNYGARVKSGEALAEKSPDLMPALAGQALNSFTPRGIQGALAGGGGLAGTAAALGGAMNPALLGSLVAASPRLVGEAAHGLGKLRGMLPNANQAAILPGGGAGIPSIAGMDPRLLAMMSPQLLAQLLAAQSPARQ